VTLKYVNEKEARMAGRKETNEHPVIEDRPQPTEDEIRERAYQIYNARNGGPGDEVNDWLKAEAELKAEG
jgi:Protein of unknown function (DUF2934)